MLIQPIWSGNGINCLLVRYHGPKSKCTLTTKRPCNMQASLKKKENRFHTSTSVRFKLTRHMRELARRFTWQKTNCTKTHLYRFSYLILKFLTSLRCLQLSSLMDLRDSLATMRSTGQIKGALLLRIFFDKLGLHLVTRSLWGRFAGWANQKKSRCTSLKSKATTARCCMPCLMLKQANFIGLWVRLWSWPAFKAWFREVSQLMISTTPHAKLLEKILLTLHWTL